MSSISLCAPEIWLEVTVNLEQEDLKSLSLTSRFFREIAASKLFKRLKFQNIRTAELDFIEPFIAKYGPFVTKLHYECELYPRQEGDAGNLAMPRMLQDVLAGDGLPNLQNVELSFQPGEDFDEPDEDWSFSKHEELGSLAIYRCTESGLGLERAEMHYQWRMDIRETFSAIMQNTQLEHLEISNLMPLISSSWHSELWGMLLARLKTFKLQLWGNDEEFSHSNTIEGYGDFMAELQPNFFQHLKNLRSLHLAAEPSNMLGCTGRYYSPFPIGMDDLPCLEELTLEHFFIDRALVDFLTQKSEQIRSIKFIDTWAATEICFAEDPICWALFCRSIREVCPSSLVDFQITYKERIEFCWTEGLESNIFPTFFGYQLSTTEIDTGRHRLADGVKLFPYGELDDKYGYAGSQDVSILKSLIEGSDLAEYKALMKLVEKNRKALLLS